MRWRSVLEGVHQEAKLSLSLFGREAQYLKHFLLQLGIVNTDATAAHFDTIDNHVVCVGAHACGICVQQRDIFGLRTGKRMMHSHEAIFLV